MSQPPPFEMDAQEAVPQSVSAAAHVYQLAMQQQSSGATPPTIMTPQPLDSVKDVAMNLDGTPDRPAVGNSLLSLSQHIFGKN